MKVKYLVCILIVLLISGGIIGGVYYYNRTYLPKKHLEDGFVIVKTFDCPSDHPIKAHLGSMIYHLRFDPYYSRTNAANGYCFDTVGHAKQKGFRPPYNP